MTSPFHALTQTLYEQDYCLWLEKTIEQLRSRQFSGLDLDNLIEELESMGRSDRRAIKSLLTKLLEHLLKLAYWASEREYNANKWKVEIRTFRQQITDLLTDSPSLKPYLAEIFEECYGRARNNVIDLIGLSANTFPIDPVANLDQTLDENWLSIIDFSTDK